MFNLALKDIVIQKKIILVTIIFIIAYAILITFTNSTINLVNFVPIVITYTSIMGACSIDDKNNSNALFASLPIKRNYIVLGKYLSAFIFLVIGIIISIILLTVLNINKFNALEDILIPTLSSLTCASLLCSIFFPVYFKFDYLKSRYFNILLFFAAFFLPGILYPYLKKPINSILANLQYTPNSIIILWILIFIIVVNTISIMISINIFEKKDL